MVDDKMHARLGFGPGSLITQQPSAVKRSSAVSVFGEMEVWALEAFGAANILCRRPLTIKSDDVMGPCQSYEADRQRRITCRKPAALESPNVLLHELVGFAISV